MHGSSHFFSWTSCLPFLHRNIRKRVLPRRVVLPSLFYNRKQFDLRTTFLYAGSQLGNAFDGLFATAILKLDNVHGIEGWRWLFIIEGSATVVIVALFAYLLPHHSKTTRMVSELEREWILWNYEKDEGQECDVSEIIVKQGFMMAVSVPKVWLLMGTLYAVYICGAVVCILSTLIVVTEHLDG